MAGWANAEPSDKGRRRVWGQSFKIAIQVGGEDHLAAP